MQYWEPGTNYPAGAQVEYEGHRYKIIQPHTSQSDWTPVVTPALWGRLDDHDTGESNYHQAQQQHAHHHRHHSQGEKQLHDVLESQAPRPSGQSVDIHHEERQKHWYDLDDNRKKELEIGGGLLAGAALIAGGYAAFKGHEKNEQEKKSQTWALQNWLHDAQVRTTEYYQRGPRSPATWLLVEGPQAGKIPQGAIAVGQEVGRESSWMLYICRAFYEGGIQVGKASEAFKKGAVIGYKHEEIHLSTYEVLVGDMDGLRWVDASGVLNVSQLGYQPVEGGREPDGTPLYIAEASYDGVAHHPGKASEMLDGAYIPHGGTEKNVKSYRVLCYV
ncbi:carbohydrate-binding module family 12 protein [Mycena maculata]|uniref:Carbohydrate-binding module family 12 protein n=1 Tax=Mycena maculata TaxID=230809 RepID=A0AAD7ND21_9AGAR|nr:carbohydrate-binding module family 12 protein [Mycena maculata]